MPTEIGCTSEGQITAVLDISNTDTRGFPQSFDARPGVLLLVLDEAETFPHHFASVLIAPFSDESLDKLSLMLCKNDVARRHGCYPAIVLRLAYYAIKIGRSIPRRDFLPIELTDAGE